MYKLIILSGSAVLFYSTYKFILKYIEASWLYKIIYAAVLGLAISLVLTFFGIHLPLDIAGDIESMNTISWIKNITTGSKEAAIEFADKNCVLIDCSGEIDTIAESAGNKVIITDRDALAKTLNTLLPQKNKIDLIIVDIYFDKPGKNDSALQSAFDPWTEDSRLIVAKAVSNDIFYKNNPAVLALIEQKDHSDLLYEYALYKGENFSVPYLAYLRLNKNISLNRSSLSANYAIENNNNRKHFLTRYFTPDYLLRDDDIIDRYKNHPVESGAIINKVSEENGIPNEYTMREMMEGDTSMVSWLMSINNKEGRKNIVIISAFNDPQRDIINTMQGPVHGGVLQIDVLYNLISGNHYNFFKKIFLFWLIFAMLSWIQIIVVFRKLSRSGKKSYSLPEFFREEIYRIIFLVTLLTIGLAIHSLPNIMIIIIFFSVNERIWEWVYNRSLIHKAKRTPEKR